MLRTKLTLSTLVATIVLAGCSTQMTQPVQKDVSATKVEAVKATPEFDLGAKNGVSTTVNLNFSKTNSPFGIKSVFDGFQATSFLADTNSYVIVHFYKYTNAANENPKGRFDGVASADFDSDTVADRVGSGIVLTSGLTGTKTFKLNGLMPNKKYYVSARAFTAGVNLTSDYKIDISAAGLLTADPLSPTPSLTSIGFGFNDTFVIDTGSGPIAYRVVNLAPLTVVDFLTGAAPAAVDGNLATATYLERNVVSEGSLGGVSLGDGQGTTGSVVNGGGTAGGFGTAGDTEEFIQVGPSGTVNIINDDTPGSPGVQNAIMDIQIQLKQDKKPQIPGEVKVNAGNPDATAESISNP